MAVRCEDHITGCSPPPSSSLPLSTPRRTLLAARTFSNFSNRRIRHLYLKPPLAPVIHLSPSTLLQPRAHTKISSTMSVPLNMPIPSPMHVEDAIDRPKTEGDILTTTELLELAKRTENKNGIRGFKYRKTAGLYNPIPSSGRPNSSTTSCFAARPDTCPSSFSRPRPRNKPLINNSHLTLEGTILNIHETNPVRGCVPPDTSLRRRRHLRKLRTRERWFIPQ